MSAANYAGTVLESNLKSGAAGAFSGTVIQEADDVLHAWASSGSLFESRRML